MKVLVYGAGLIGQVYGARLARAGHDVTLLARTNAAALAQRGVRLRRDGVDTAVSVPVAEEVPTDIAWDAVLVTVRRDQIESVVPALVTIPATRVVFLLNQCLDLDRVRATVGADRTVFAFPGIGGRRHDDGTIEYLQVPQQKTTIERRADLAGSVVELLRSADFSIELTDRMDGWLKTHAVFITAVGAAILSSGGDSGKLASAPDRVAEMVLAVREGFAALARRGVPVIPGPLRFIFSTAPRFVAIRYWQQQLRGPVGTLAISPHIRASRDSELPALVADVRALIGAAQATPHLDYLLALANLRQ
ncbi:MAG TPA: 2-dehydropantoate 2-reductase N-terminal domain-containing protein [Rugosimonospora sp.]|nr:2-dehydropantoate 2-reductase N-terminal domain-containing protein [Rugosimonospora sp.]